MDRKSPVDTRIGQRLKEYRQYRGMTVRQLADAAHRRARGCSAITFAGALRISWQR